MQRVVGYRVYSDWGNPGIDNQLLQYMDAYHQMTSAAPHEGILRECPTRSTRCNVRLRRSAARRAHVQSLALTDLLWPRCIQSPPGLE